MCEIHNAGKTYETTVCIMSNGNSIFIGKQGKVIVDSEDWICAAYIDGSSECN